MTDVIEKAMGVDLISKGRYRSKMPLQKPRKESRGVFGGNFVGQALLVSIKESPEGFYPHLLHSFFVKAGSSEELLEWKVEEVTHGKTFRKVHLECYQKVGLVYSAQVSLTRLNSHKAAREKHEDYKKKLEEAENEEVIEELKANPVPLPLQIQTPLADPQLVNEVNDMEMKTPAFSFVHRRYPAYFYNMEQAAHETKLNASERRLTYAVKYAPEEDSETPFSDHAFNFVGLGVMSDSFWWTSFLRALRVPVETYWAVEGFFGISLDHSLYIHDADFDVSKWMFCSFRFLRFVNNRGLIECEIYNHGGSHVATVIQEGLVFLNDKIHKAKL